MPEERMVVLVHDAEDVSLPFHEVVGCLGLEAAAVITSAAEAARAEDERIRTKVGPAGWPSALAQSVDVHVTPLRPHRDGYVLSMTWDAPALFPTLEAELELSPLEAGSSRIVLRGHYDPPGGVLGRGLDRLVLHRVADATVRAFLVELRRSIEARTCGDRPVRPAGADPPLRPPVPYM